jgi:hypothetical protein
MNLQQILSTSGCRRVIDALLQEGLQLVAGVDLCPDACIHCSPVHGRQAYHLRMETLKVGHP